jgi:hypothetical protein
MHRKLQLVYFENINRKQKIYDYKCLFLFLQNKIWQPQVSRQCDRMMVDVVLQNETCSSSLITDGSMNLVVKKHEVTGCDNINQQHHI